MPAALVPQGWYPLLIPYLVCLGLLLGPPSGALWVVNMALFSIRLLLLPLMGPLAYTPLANEGGSELPVCVRWIISDACPHHPSRLLQ